MVTVQEYRQQVEQARRELEQFKPKIQQTAQQLLRASPLSQARTRGQEAQRGIAKQEALKNIQQIEQEVIKIEAQQREQQREQERIDKIRGAFDSASRRGKLNYSDVQNLSREDRAFVEDKWNEAEAQAGRNAERLAKFEQAELEKDYSKFLKETGQNFGTQTERELDMSIPPEFRDLSIEEVTTRTSIVPPIMSIASIQDLPELKSVKLPSLGEKIRGTIREKTGVSIPSLIGVEKESFRSRPIQFEQSLGFAQEASSMSFAPETRQIFGTQLREEATSQYYRPVTFKETAKDIFTTPLPLVPELERTIRRQIAQDPTTTFLGRGVSSATLFFVPKTIGEVAIYGAFGKTAKVLGKVPIARDIFFAGAGGVTIASSVPMLRTARTPEQYGEAIAVAGLGATGAVLGGGKAIERAYKFSKTPFKVKVELPSKSIFFAEAETTGKVTKGVAKRITIYPEYTAEISPFKGLLSGKVEIPKSQFKYTGSADISIQPFKITDKKSFGATFTKKIGKRKSLVTIEQTLEKQKPVETTNLLKISKEFQFIAGKLPPRETGLSGIKSFVGVGKSVKGVGPEVSPKIVDIKNIGKLGKLPIKTPPSIKLKDLKFKGKDLSKVKLKKQIDVEAVRDLINKKTDIKFKGEYVNPLTGELETSISKVGGALEPQVKKGVEILNKKGYETISSGFTPEKGVTGFEQHILFKGTLTPNLKLAAKKAGLNIKKSQGYLEVSTSIKGKSLEQISKQFKKFSDLVPSKVPEVIIDFPLRLQRYSKGQTQYLIPTKTPKTEFIKSFTGVKELASLPGNRKLFAIESATKRTKGLVGRKAGKVTTDSGLIFIREVSEESGTKFLMRRDVKKTPFPITKEGLEQIVAQVPQLIPPPKPRRVSKAKKEQITPLREATGKVVSLGAVGSFSGQGVKFIQDFSLGPLSFPQLVASPIQRPSTRTGLIFDTLDITKPREDLRFTPAFRDRESFRFKQPLIEKTELRNLFVQPPALREIPSFRSPQREKVTEAFAFAFGFKQAQRVAFEFRTPTSAIPPRPIPPRRPPTPTPRRPRRPRLPPLLPIDEKKRERVEKVSRERFVAFVRRRGKFIPVSKALTFKEARFKGIKTLRETLGASLQIRKSKTGEAVKFAKVTSEFNLGKSGKDPFTLVQRRISPLGGRLASPSERREIVSARGGLKWFR